MPSTTADNERDSEQPQESVSIRISKKQGEKAIQVLTNLKLLNRKLAPQRTARAIDFPLSRTPELEEQRHIERVLVRPTVSKQKFHSRYQTSNSLEQVLAEQLPPSIVSSVSKSFDIIGDIAIIELSPPTQPYEKIIAQSLVKVHKNIRTVYAKAGPINDNLRLRPVHHVLGPNRTKTIHRELGCRFKIDISKAFFSPRLSEEHRRVSEQVRPGECVVDMFAGVGPFSVLIAKRVRDVEIHAIDANREAANLIRENARINKVEDRIEVWADDARAVIRSNLSKRATRVIMNHPSQARGFIDCALDALGPRGGTVHYYTFSDGVDSQTKAGNEFTEPLSNSGWKTENPVETRKVRGVAPMKWQVAVDAKLVPA
jgi:tRNA (guanine37-N1)-methyltransferase